MSAPPHLPLRHRDVLGLAWPIVVSMLSVTAMTVVDTIYVGRLGTPELAAIGVSTSVVYLVTAFGSGLLAGARVHVARATGADRVELAGGYAWSGVWLALGMGLLVALTAAVGPVVFPWMGASERVVPLASAYFGARTLGAPVSFVFQALTVGFQGRGDTRTPMVAIVAANAANILLDPLLIFGFGPVPGLGIVGAAVATVIGVALGVAILLVRAPAVLGPCRAPAMSWLRDVWDVGSPLGVSQLLDVASFVVFASLLATTGDAHLAAHVVVVRIIMIAFMPCHAIGEAVGVLVGHSLGAARPERAREALRLGTVQAVSLMVGMGVVYVALPDALIGVFRALPEVHALARSVLLLYASFQVIDAVATVVFGALGGAGDTRFVMRVSVFAAWTVKLPVSLALVLGGDLGVLGAWLGIAAEIGFLAAVGTWRARGSGWLSRPATQGVPAG
jgi:multidrug resistance protein, MATE family